MKTNWNKPRTLALVAAIVAGGALGAGCGAAAPTAQESDATILVANLPDVQGCDSVSARSDAAIRVQLIQGTSDLYLVSADGQALCIDGAEGVRSAMVRLHLTVDAAWSNPMPGTDPAASNPMPGTDPASSNPMPGNNK
jgi:hypothetical protein